MHACKHTCLGMLDMYHGSVGYFSISGNQTHNTATLPHFLNIVSLQGPLRICGGCNRYFTDTALTYCAEIGSSETVKETGCTVSYYVNTAESVAADGTKVTLHERDLWAEFYKCATEMIITKAGR